MKIMILRHTWTIVVAVIATVIGTLIANSFTKWWTALANFTNGSWDTIAKALADALTYRAPIWTVVVTLALVVVVWRTSRKIKEVPSIRPTTNQAPNFRDYREDTFDGVLCKWDYVQSGSGLEVGTIICFCQHCDFIIGKPNRHMQQCSSCLKRAVKCNNHPFHTNDNLRRHISGYKRRENQIPFERFIRLEIDRLIRTGEFSNRIRSETD